MRALVAEIRRLNTIAVCPSDLVRALEPARLTTTPKLLLVALVERLETPATGREQVIRALSGMSAKVDQLADQIEALKKSRG